MTSLERKKKQDIQIRLNPFVLFIVASIVVHGLGIFGFVRSQRSQLAKTAKTPSTPIDFIPVPPEESPVEPPPDTRNRAVNNSIAKGKVQPELPVTTPKVVTPRSSNITQPDLSSNPATAVVPQNPTPEKIETTPPTPKAPETAKTTTPTPSAEIAPTPIKRSPPVTQSPQITKVPKTEARKPIPSTTQKTEPIEKTPLLSESNATSIPTPKTTNSQSESSPVATNSTNLPPKPKPIESASPPSTETPTTPENTSVPETKPTPPSEPKTPASSGAASLLAGTNSRSLAKDAEDFFFSSQVNASQQAANSSGLNARQNTDLAPYFAEVRRRVKRNWRPSTPNKNRNTVLVFSIQRNGQITGLSISQSSGSPQADRESLKAVQNSAPFAALPASFPNPQLDVQFSFNLYFNN